MYKKLTDCQSFLTAYEKTSCVACEKGFYWYICLQKSTLCIHFNVGNSGQYFVFSPTT